MDRKTVKKLPWHEIEMAGKEWIMTRPPARKAVDARLASGSESLPLGEYSQQAGP
jgi:hypothetical protein